MNRRRAALWYYVIVFAATAVLAPTASAATEATRFEGTMDSCHETQRFVVTRAETLHVAATATGHAYRVEIGQQNIWNARGADVAPDAPVADLAFTPDTLGEVWVSVKGAYNATSCTAAFSVVVTQDDVPPPPPDPTIPTLTAPRVGFLARSTGWYPDHEDKTYRQRPIALTFRSNADPGLAWDCKDNDAHIGPGCIETLAVEVAMSPTLDANGLFPEKNGIAGIAFESWKEPYAGQYKSAKPIRLEAGRYWWYAFVANDCAERPFGVPDLTCPKSRSAIRSFRILPPKSARPSYCRRFSCPAPDFGPCADGLSWDTSACRQAAARAEARRACIALYMDLGFTRIAAGLRC